MSKPYVMYTKSNKEWHSDLVCTCKSPLPHHILAAMITLYYESSEMRKRIEGLLTPANVESTECRDDFRTRLGAAGVGIAELKRCSDEDIEWLQEAFGRDLSGPSCVVVTPLSLGRLQRLRTIESSRLHVVWQDEAEDRLMHVLDRIKPWHREPLQALGNRLLSDRSLHWSLVRALNHICGLSEETRNQAPSSSVSAIARRARIPPDALRRYWRGQVPLRCSPKQLLQWSLLLWAVRERSRHNWGVVSRKAGVRRRTLERYSTKLAGCSLAVAALDPVLLQRRFGEWLARVSEMDADDVT